MAIDGEENAKRSDLQRAVSETASLDPRTRPPGGWKPVRYPANRRPALRFPILIHVVNSCFTTAHIVAPTKGKGARPSRTGHPPFYRPRLALVRAVGAAV